MTDVAAAKTISEAGFDLTPPDAGRSASAWRRTSPARSATCCCTTAPRRRSAAACSATRTTASTAAGCAACRCSATRPSSRAAPAGPASTRRFDEDHVVAGARHQLRHGPHRDPLRALRQPPGPRVPRRPAADPAALLHQLGLAAVREDRRCRCPTRWAGETSSSVTRQGAARRAARGLPRAPGRPCRRPCPG